MATSNYTRDQSDQRETQVTITKHDNTRASQSRYGLRLINLQSGMTLY